MTEYWLPLLYVIALHLFSRYDKYSIRVVSVILVLPLALFAGLRGDIGPDYNEYKRLFCEIADISNILDLGLFNVKFHFEPIYILVVAAINTIFNCSAFVLIFAITAFTSIYLNIKSFKDYSPYYLIAVALYISHDFLLKELIQIRIGIAASIIFYSLRYMGMNRLKFFGGIFLAAGFHYSVLVTLALPIIHKYIDKKYTIVLWLIASLLLYIFDIVGSIINIPEFKEAFWKILNYMNDSSENYDLGLSNPTTIKKMVLIVLLASCKEKLFEKYVYAKQLLSGYLFSTILIVSLGHHAIFAARLAAIYSVTEYVLLLMAISCVQSRASRLILLTLMILSSFIIMHIHIGIEGRFRPYEFEL